MRAVASKALGWAKRTLTEAFRPRPLATGLLRDVFRTRTAQQLRDASPFRSGPQGLLRDGDPKYGTAFDRVADGAGIEVIRIAPCTPRRNAVVERFLGAIRRECLDHVILLGEPHLRSVLGQYVETYFNTMRPHQGIGQRIPVSTPRQTCNVASKVVAIPVLGGLHHGYRAAA